MGMGKLPEPIELDRGSPEVTRQNELGAVICEVCSETWEVTWGWRAGVGKEDYRDPNGTSRGRERHLQYPGKTETPTGVE